MDIKATSDDGSLPEDNYLSKYLKLLTEAAAKGNRRLDIAPHLHEYLQEAGFEEVTETSFKLPM
ncbi:MAG: hypothetical protein M1830_005829, partial [Pleopsidium flavum]